jgi:hypothetical protein
VLVAFLKSDERIKETSNGTTIRAEACLCINVELILEDLQPTHECRRQQLRANVELANTAPILAEQQVLFYFRGQKNQPLCAVQNTSSATNQQLLLYDLSFSLLSYWVDPESLMGFNPQFDRVKEHNR